MRYVYVKNGDAVAQLRNIAQADEVDKSGPDAFIADFVRAHAADEVLVLCRAQRGEQFRWKNVVARSFTWGGGPLERAVTRWLATLKVGLATLRSRPQRILCGCTGEMLWISALAARLLRVPFVHSRHNDLPPARGLRRLVYWLDRLSLATCTGVVCHGPYLAAQLRDHGLAGQNLHEFEVDLADFAGSMTDAHERSGLADFAARFGTVFLYVGRMQRSKGIFDLLQAFADLVEKGHRAGLVYVGDGPDFAELQAGARKLRLEQTVLCLGRRAHRDLPRILREATVVVTPTRPEFPEGRCMAALEALVLGRPVIAPNLGPFPYAVEHDRNGLLFAAGDATDLLSCLVRIMEDAGVLARVSSGAAQTAREIIDSRRSFALAVDRAFAAGGT